MDTKEALQMLGLNDKESAVYLALLQLGRAAAYSISVKSGLKRPTTYVILEELINKGLVVQVPREKKQLYVAKSPEEAFLIMQERFDLAKQKLPEILALTRGEATKVNAVYFEGMEGLKQTMEYGFKDMAGKEIVGFYATSENLPKELSDYFLEWNEKRANLNITMRGIAPDHISLKGYRETDSKFKAVFKAVPYDQFSSQIAMDVLGKYVRIHDYKNLQGVVIENAEVAKTVRQIFEMLWQKI
jgi:sugar-specific transcriptional regulator TrmB